MGDISSDASYRRGGVAGPVAGSEQLACRHIQGSTDHACPEIIGDHLTEVVDNYVSAVVHDFRLVVSLAARSSAGTGAAERRDLVHVSDSLPPQPVGELSRRPAERERSDGDSQGRRRGLGQPVLGRIKVTGVVLGHVMAAGRCRIELVGCGVSGRDDHHDVQFANELVQHFGQRPEVGIAVRLGVADGQIENSYSVSTVKMSDALGHEIVWKVRGDEAGRIVGAARIRFEDASDANRAVGADALTTPEFFMQVGEKQASDDLRSMMSRCLPWITGGPMRSMDLIRP